MAFLLAGAGIAAQAQTIDPKSPVAEYLGSRCKGGKEAIVYVDLGSGAFTPVTKEHSDVHAAADSDKLRDLAAHSDTYALGHCHPYNPNPTAQVLRPLPGVDDIATGLRMAALARMSGKECPFTFIVYEEPGARTITQIRMPTLTLEEAMEIQEQFAQSDDFHFNTPTVESLRIHGVDIIEEYRRDLSLYVKRATDLVHRGVAPNSVVGHAWLGKTFPITITRYAEH